MRLLPDRSFVENMRRLAEHARNSQVLDSRVDFWCARTGVDPELRRVALASGYVVRFTCQVRGRTYVVHTIQPTEIK